MNLLPAEQCRALHGGSGVYHSQLARTTYRRPFILWYCSRHIALRLLRRTAWC